MDQVSRRQIIAGLAAAPLLTLPEFGSVMAAPVPLAAPSRTVSKRQRSNINVSVGDYFKDRKFINCAKAGSRVIRNSGGTLEWYQNIDGDHYPTEGQIGVTFAASLNGQGTYVVKWRGKGAVTSPSIGSKQNAPKGIWTGGGADAAIVENGRFTCVAGHTYTSFSVKGPSITDLVICRAEEEALLDSGQVFRPQYLDLIKSYNGVLRFSIGPDCANRNVLTNWSDRPLPTLMTYNGGRYYPGKKIGQLMGNGIYKTPAYTGMPASYTQGEIFHFSVAQDSNLANCTLDVGGRGPKPLLTEYLAPLDTAGTNAETRLLATANYSAIYDATLGCWIFVKQSPVTGHPLEIMVAECNAVGCRGWFSIPFNASDDYVKKFSQLLCDTYKQDAVYIEYVNEIWNYAYGFPMTKRAARYGASLLGLSSGNFADISGWYGLRFRQIADIVRDVFAKNGQSSKLKMVLACQGATGDTTASLQNVVENARFQNSTVSELSGPNAPLTRADVISYALYYTGQSTRSTDSGWSSILDKARGPLKQAVDQFLSGDPAMRSTAFAWMAQDLLVNEAAHATGRFKNWNTIAAKYSKEVCLYECNHEITAPSAAWCTNNLGDASYGNTNSIAGKIQQFFNAFFDSVEYQTVVSKYLQDFYSLSQSASFSLSAFCAPDPWLVFPKASPSDTTGDSLGKPYANWRANVTWNASH